jgi:hypothetical protein
MTNATSKAEKSQLDKFKEAARALECDDDDARFAGRVGKLVSNHTVDNSVKKQGSHETG